MKKSVSALALAAVLLCALLPISAGAVTVTEIVPCKYDYVSDFSEGLAAVELDGKRGFIDKTGKEVISRKYDSVGDFSEGLAAVKLNGKWGVIDKTGKEVLPCTLEYSYVYPFSDGLAAVTALNGKYGYIDKTGKEVVPLGKYDEPLGGMVHFSEGLAAVKKDGRAGYIDTTGKEVIPLRYNQAADFSEGLAKVLKYGEMGQFTTNWSFIDKTGKEVLSLDEYYWGDGIFFSEGLAAVKRDGKYGYVDQTGKEVIPCQYNNMSKFSEGLAAVTTDENYKTSDAVKWSYIDKTGKEVFSCKYVSAGAFHDGLASVMDENWKWGFIDKTGKEVVPCKYDDVNAFSEGLAAVEVEEGYDSDEQMTIYKWGFLSVNGGGSSAPTGYTAKATNDKLTVGGVSKTPTAYKINNANYFQLRDVAVLLNGTKAQFSIEYDNAAKAIKITTGQPYAPNGKEMKGAKATAEAIVGNNDVYINGVKTDFAVYKIGGSNFFQIRDLGKALGFNVDWAKDVGIIIDPSKPYGGK